jgi:glycolate oxidase
VVHAGDGNLHPRLAFDRRDAAQTARVMQAGEDIIRTCVAVGGVLTGEHGVGIEKRDFMPLTFSAVDLEAQACTRAAFDPRGRINPDKVLPRGSRCGELGGDLAALPDGAWV